MKKIIVILFFTMPILCQAFGLTYNPVYHSSANRKQPTKSGFDLSKIVVGGNIGLSYLQGGAYYAINPMVGYQIHKNLILGTSVNYSWQGYTSTYNSFPIKVRNHDLGLSVFARPVIAHFLIFDIEPELNFLSEKYTFPSGGYNDLTNRYRPTSFLLGGGYYRPFSSNGGSFIMILFDVLQNANSPYAPNSFVNFRMGMMMSNIFGGRK